MIKAIFYDFDGVIKESGNIKTDAFYAMYLPFGKDIANKVVAHHVANGGISRYEKFRKYHLDFLGEVISDKQLQELAQQFSQLVLEKVVQCDYVPGAKESIIELSKNYAQYIVTGTPEVEIEKIVEELNIAQYFKGVLGSPANKIDISQKILNQTDLKANEVVFIGDAPADLKAAQHHQFHFVLREYEENEAIFEGQNLNRIKDLVNFVQLISNHEFE